jgi:hypothetical protein
MDTVQDLLLQREQPATPKGSRGIFSPDSSREAASLNLAAPAPGAKKLGYYSEKEYLMELPRRRIEQEIKKRFKPGDDNFYTCNFTRSARGQLAIQLDSVLLHVAIKTKWVDLRAIDCQAAVAI